MKNKLSQKIISLLLIIAACFACFFFASQKNSLQTQQTFTGFYFNTVINITFYDCRDAKLSSECFALCEHYENLLSRTVEGSDIWNINHSKGEWVLVSPETYSLLEIATLRCQNTNGLLDYTVAPLMELWDFTGSNPDKRPPDSNDITKALKGVDYRNVLLSDQKVRLTNPETKIDLGFIAKGYIGDKIREFLISKGVTSAIINLGGNILTIGSKPNGEPYQIGINNPKNTNNHIDILSVTNRCVTTSGTYERMFVYDGMSYHHILDPQTGMPVQNGLSSVTILSDDATTGDALSTACLLLGKEKGLEFIKSFPNIQAVFIEENGTITKVLPE